MEVRILILSCSDYIQALQCPGRGNKSKKAKYMQYMLVNYKCFTRHSTLLMSSSIVLLSTNNGNLPINGMTAEYNLPLYKSLSILDIYIVSDCR